MTDSYMRIRRILLKDLPMRVKEHGVTYIGDAVVSGGWQNAVYRTTEEAGFTKYGPEEDKVNFAHFSIHPGVGGVILVAQIDVSFLLGILCNSSYDIRMLNSRMLELGGFEQYMTNIPDNRVFKTFGVARDTYKRYLSRIERTKIHTLKELNMGTKF